MSINSAFLNISPLTSASCLQALEASCSKTMFPLRNETFKWYQQIIDVSNKINLNSVNENREADGYSLCTDVVLYLNNCKHSEIQSNTFFFFLSSWKVEGKNIVKKH